jgi:phosphoribosylanthranilate isomerase
MNERARAPARLWIKICGLTTEEAVSAAAAAGADAIGFVFAPSKRQVTPTRAAQLARCAPPALQRVAVLLHPTQALVDAVLETFAPDVLQTDAEDFATLQTPQHVQRLPVLRRPTAQPPPRILFEGAVSGTGERSDWAEAAKLAAASELVLAGGLTPANVQRALREVRPFGVDVSSGVESAPGVKDPAKIHEFVRNARAGVEAK